MKPKRNAIDEYNTKTLSSPRYTPIGVIRKLTDMYFPDHDSVSAETVCRLLQCDKCTLSKILNRHMVITPRIVISILDLTGWSMEQFRELSGMPPLVEQRTRNQIEDLCRRTGTLAQSVRRGNAATDRG